VIRYKSISKGGEKRHLAIYSLNFFSISFATIYLRNQFLQKEHNYGGFVIVVLAKAQNVVDTQATFGSVNNKK